MQRLFRNIQFATVKENAQLPSLFTVPLVAFPIRMCDFVYFKCPARVFLSRKASYPPSGVPLQVAVLVEPWYWWRLIHVSSQFLNVNRPQVATRLVISHWYCVFFTCPRRRLALIANFLLLFGFHWTPIGAVFQYKIYVSGSHITTK